MQPLTLTAVPLHYASKGRMYRAELNGRTLVDATRTPFVDGARALLAEGADSAALVTMRHVGAQADSFDPMPLADAARWGVTEPDASSVRFVRWQARDFAGVSNA